MGVGAGQAHRRQIRYQLRSRAHKTRRAQKSRFVRRSARRAQNEPFGGENDSYFPRTYHSSRAVTSYSTSPRSFPLREPIRPIPEESLVTQSMHSSKNCRQTRWYSAPLCCNRHTGRHDKHLSSCSDRGQAPHGWHRGTDAADARCTWIAGRERSSHTADTAVGC